MLTLRLYCTYPLLKATYSIRGLLRESDSLRDSISTSLMCLMFPKLAVFVDDSVV